MLTNVNRREIGFLNRANRSLWRTAVAVLAAILMLAAPLASSLAKPSGHQKSQAQTTVKAGTQTAKKGKHLRDRTHRRSAQRKNGKARRVARHAAKRPQPTRAAILVDARTGEVLRERNADARAYPASLAKMMTLYLTFEDLNKGRLSLDQRLPVSAKAAGQEPTKLWLKSGETVRVSSLILALVTRSANDAAVVLAEAIGGSEAAFARRMTSTARRLGMTSTVFRNASGLPDPKQRTTARDMARLALALYQDFPREYAYFAAEQFEFRGKTIKGHNHLLESYDGADGLKTGYIDASGFNLAASAERNGDRLIGVIMGGPSWRQRDKEMVALLDRGFAELGSAARAIAKTDPVLPSRGSEEKAAKIAKAGARFAAMFSTSAEAAPLARRDAATSRRKTIKADSAKQAAPARTAVQLGAFSGQKAARKHAKSVASLKAARGKIVRIVKPARGDAKKLYRVQLHGLTREGAGALCTKLKKTMPCMVVQTSQQAQES